MVTVFPVIVQGVALGLLVTACDVSQMTFVQDHRVRIVEPVERAKVTLPLNVRWQVRDFNVTGRDGRAVEGEGYFAVFVDRPAIPPGKTLEWFAKQDDSCGRNACGSIENIEFIYTTDDTVVRLDQLPDLRDADGRELHEAVIVLLNGKGARMGESAFYVRFNFEREA